MTYCKLRMIAVAATMIAVSTMHDRAPASAAPAAAYNILSLGHGAILLRWKS